MAYDIGIHGDSLDPHMALLLFDIFFFHDVHLRISKCNFRSLLQNGAPLL